MFIIEGFNKVYVEIILLTFIQPATKQVTKRTALQNE
jgi:hypothetical protein